MPAENTVSVARACELYSNGGVSELYRGVRDFILTRFRQFRLTLGTTFSREQTVSIQGHEINLKTDTPTEYKRATTLMGERDVLKDFIANIQPNDMVWDIGSNIGLFATFGATIAAETVAVEPVPANIAALRANLEQNGLSEQTTVIEAALGSSPGTVDVPADPSAGENHILTGGTDGTTTTAPIKRGDELIESGTVPAPTVLKMDIEGGEADALEGLESALQTVRLAYIEVHGQQLVDIGRSIDDVETALRDAGFDIQPLEGRRDDNYHLKAERQQ